MHLGGGMAILEIYFEMNKKIKWMARGINVYNKANIKMLIVKFRKCVLTKIF